jgi:hypothetical protein
MAIRLDYETKAGNFSEAETYLQLIEHLRLGCEAAYAIGHYKKANDEELLGQGWLAIGQLLERTCTAVTNLATKGIRQ